MVSIINTTKKEDKKKKILVKLRPLPGTEQEKRNRIIKVIIESSKELDMILYNMYGNHLKIDKEFLELFNRLPTRDINDMDTIIYATIQRYNKGETTSAEVYETLRKAVEYIYENSRI